MDTSEGFLAELQAHRKILYKVASLYCANSEDRQDLMQEIAIQLWRSRGSFDGRSRFSTWTYRVALNVAISWVRDHRRMRGHVTTDSLLFDAASLEEASRDVPHDLRLFLTQVIDRLNELDRALILLYLEGHDYEAIAEIVGLTSTNVSTKISRIRSRLQREHGGSGT